LLDPTVAGNPSGPFLAGWPVKVGIVLSDLLPTVGHGVPGSAVLADIDDDGNDEVFVHANNGPPFLVDGDGTSIMGVGNDKFRTLDVIGGAGTNPQATSTDFKLVFGVVGFAAAGDVNADGVLDFAMPTAGVLQLLDNQGPALQGPGDNQVTAWTSAAVADAVPALNTGDMLRAFPRRVEDLQFLTGPTVGDFDGDGTAEVVEGSGGYYVHAFRGTGGQPIDWPKFTGGWISGAVALGDVDGDGSIDAVAGTREGRLYAWEGAGPSKSPAVSAIQWATVDRDARHTSNMNSGVPTSVAPAGCETMFRGVISKATGKFKAGALNDSVKVKGSFTMPGRSFDPTTSTVRVAFGGIDGVVYEAEVPPGSFVVNSSGTSFSFKDSTLAIANGIQKVKIQNKKGQWVFQVMAKDVDATVAGSQAYFFLQIGSECVERLRPCESLKSGELLKCS
jgi:hypothetical protein